MPPPLAGALLAALRSKGVTADEVRGFARAMRALARRPAIAADAACHRHRRHRRRCLGQLQPVHRRGAADRGLWRRRGQARQSLGVEQVRQRRRARTARAQTTAGRGGGRRLPRGHALHLPVRAALPPGDEGGRRRSARRMGVRTVFNILGPADQSRGAAIPAHRCVQPAHRAADGRRAVGPAPSSAPSSCTARRAGTNPRRSARSRCSTCARARSRRAIRSPSDYGLDLCGARDLAGGDAASNARALRAVLCGEDRGAHRDALLLGTALALEIVGRVDDPREGVRIASAAIDSGAARKTLDAIASFGARGAA